ncbi:hypothetical protein VOLCADRAFT_94138 [Volvox carteri f. nagariensis]|uniref:C2H2-type domain-containing protein n=1 Tax=Volvox carteri f. nagariensis TaxID=3068 RepID=D8U490_VOLCA|nr:uncharacterized protein VOLCADRAFT_94138 [Volvox carteri f. nagariensis]EFJ45461.1 hypothetical protein VOLCADRAFT_94138 [Volvox carteri f. nagariensis]|eukprot:XP_002953488.1 hypothetical protein VOLCADRAFT_94138 [Volvox carteri f. nagariensis]
MPGDSLRHVGCIKITQGREQAGARAFQRFLKNRIKQLGTLLPPSPDAPEPDTALLWSFLSRQLSEGISNEAQVLSRAQVLSSATGSDEAGRRAAKAARRGVVIAQPRPIPADSRRTVPIPLSNWLREGAGDSPQYGSSGGPPQALVHVFWDVESAHPGNRDPRLVAVEVLRLAHRLGRVVGSYAYANRQAWAWVPTHFLSTYAEGDDNAKGSAGVRVEGSGAAAAGANGRVRCPVCGKLLTAPRLERHLRTLHPDKPAASLAATAIAQQLQVDEPPQNGGNATIGGGGSSSSAGRGGGASSAGASKKNSYRTGLGGVRAYYSSSGELYRPPAGHQLGLKYVLQREGFEPRVAQNTDDASDRALNGGIDRLLAALRNGTARAAAAATGGGRGRGELLATELPYTLVLVSGSRRHAAALGACRRLGVRTVVVTAGPGVVAEPGQVDALLSWELLAGGSYQI